MTLFEPKKSNHVCPKLASNSSKPAQTKAPAASRKGQHARRSADSGDARTTKAMTNTNWRLGREDDNRSAAKPLKTKASILSEVNANNRNGPRQNLTGEDIPNNSNHLTNSGLYKILKQVDIKGTSKYQYSTRIIEVSSVGRHVTGTDESSPDGSPTESRWVRIQPFRAQENATNSASCSTSLSDLESSITADGLASSEALDSSPSPELVRPVPAITGRRNISYHLQKSVYQLKTDPSSTSAVSSPKDPEIVTEVIETEAMKRAARDAQFLKLLEKLKSSSAAISKQAPVEDRKDSSESSSNETSQSNGLRVPMLGSGRRLATASDEGIHRQQQNRFSIPATNSSGSSHVSTGENKPNMLNPKAREFLSFSAQQPFGKKPGAQRKSVRGLFEPPSENIYQNTVDTNNLALAEPKIDYMAAEPTFVPSMMAPQYAPLPMPTFYPSMMPATLSHFPAQPVANFLVPISGHHSLPLRMGVPVAPHNSPTKPMPETQPLLPDLVPLQNALASIQSHIQQQQQQQEQPVQLPQCPLPHIDLQSLRAQKLMQPALEPLPAAKVGTKNAVPPVATSGNKTKPSSVPKPRVPDAMGQQAYEAWIEWRKANEPGYALECKMRQQRRSQRLKAKKTVEADQ